jgi:hypothetical protein
MYAPSNPIALRAIAAGLARRASAAALAECHDLAARLEESAHGFRADAARLEAFTREFA